MNNLKRFFSSAPTPKKFQVLIYNYDAKSMEDLVLKRTPLREAHLKHANMAKTDQQLVLGGAFEEKSENGLMQGMLVFDAPLDHVKKFASMDPYVKEKLVKSYDIKTWNVVVRKDE